MGRSERGGGDPERGCGEGSLEARADQPSGGEEKGGGKREAEVGNPEATAVVNHATAIAQGVPWLRGACALIYG